MLYMLMQKIDTKLYLASINTPSGHMNEGSITVCYEQVIEKNRYDGSQSKYNVPYYS